MAYKKGIFINDLADVEVMGNIAEYGKMAGRTCFIFSVVLGASEVYHAFKEHEDWIAKMMRLL